MRLGGRRASATGCSAECPLHARACNRLWWASPSCCQPGKADVRQAFQPDCTVAKCVSAAGEPVRLAARRSARFTRGLATGCGGQAPVAVSLERLTYVRLSSLTALWLNASRRPASQCDWLLGGVPASRAGLQPVVVGKPQLLSAWKG